MFLEVTAIGRLGRDPEMTYLPSGTPVTSFSMASDYVYNDNSGQKVTKTTWLRVSVFGKTAEAVNNFLKKGKMVFIQGRLSPGENGSPKVYTKNDGTPGASYDVVADTVKFLSPKDEAGSSPDGDSGSGEDIPF